jgi:hypothetical protein
MSGLIDKVVEQILKDIERGDLTALEELIQFVPINILQGFLSESDL